MKSYYQCNGITIYNADCRDILPTLDIAGIDLVLSDPPYGIACDTSHSKYKNGIAFNPIVGDNQLFDPSHLLRFNKLILWGGNCYANLLPPSRKWLAWIKTARDDAKIRQADMELAWTNCINRPRVFHHLWIGAFKASESGKRAQHPTQKPIALMEWCLNLVPNAHNILDPYMGSGTTLIAAKRMSRSAIGIEIEECYCEIAANRLEQEPLSFNLPEAT